MHHLFALFAHLALRLLHAVVIVALPAALLALPSGIASATASARGTIADLETIVENPGELTLRWTPPAEPAAGPSDYRIGWAPDGEDFRTWTDLDWNGYPAAPLSEYTIKGLDPSVAYKIRMRARYNSGIWADGPWSGPWATTEPILASPELFEVSAGEPENDDGIETRSAGTDQSETDSVGDNQNSADSHGQGTSDVERSEGDEQIVLDLDPPALTGFDTLAPELNELIARGSNGDTALSADSDAGRSVSPTTERVLVWTNASSTRSVLKFMRRNGAEVREPRDGDDVLIAQIPLTLLRSLATHQGVRYIEVDAETVPQQTMQARDVHGATRWQDAKIGGAGVRIAIVDRGFANYQSNIDAGELPTPVKVRCYTSAVDVIVETLPLCEAEALKAPGASHGTQVTEFAYDIAPDASYYLVHAPRTSDAYDAIEWLDANDIDIVQISIHCICWYGPGDGSSYNSRGLLAFVDEVSERGMTVSYAAGNNSGGAFFTDTGFNDTDNDGWFDWADNDECNSAPLTAKTNYTYMVRWDDVWNGSTIDLDIYITNAAGTTVIASSEVRQNGGPLDRPFQLIRYNPPVDGNYCLAIQYNGNSPVGWINTMIHSDSGTRVTGLEHATEGYELFGGVESKSPGLLVVGATPLSATDSLAAYSSRGPLVDGTIKPDIVGISSIPSAVVADTTASGTSFAAPHVAGLAALVKQRNPWFTPAQVATYLKDHAVDRGGTSPNASWGHGLALLPGTPAAGSAAISGNPEVGAALTVSLSGHSDPDTPLGTYGYQWFRVGDADSVAISGATSASYTAIAADEGKRLQARLRYTDTVSSIEEFLSGSTLPIEPQPEVFVSSLAQITTGTPVYLTAGLRVAQKFSTPNSGVFEVKRIELQTATALSAGSTYTVKLHGTNSSDTDAPGDAIAVLDGSLEGTGIRTFTPDSSVELAANSAYWVVIQISSISGSPSTQGRFAYKSGTAKLVRKSGWTLPQTSLRRSQTATTWTLVNDRMGIAVKGYEPIQSTTFVADAAARSIEETALGGTAVGTAIAASASADAKLTYSLAAATGHTTDLAAFNLVFELDAKTGQVQVKASGAQIDYESKSSYVVKIQVSDGKNSSGGAETTPTVDDSLTLTITVTNVDEDGVVTISGADPALNAAQTASVTDPDGNVSGVTWQWSRSSRPDIGFTDITGATNAVYTPVGADASMFLRATATYTDHLGTGKAARETTALAVGLISRTLVKNTAQANGLFDNPNVGEALFQRFITGDNPAGYTLTSIGMRINSTSGPVSLELWSGPIDPDFIAPVRMLYRLKSPTVTSGNNVEITFTAPPGVFLAPNFQYHARLSGARRIGITQNGNIDADEAHGWGIGSRIIHDFDDKLVNFYIGSMRLHVSGFALPGPPAPVQDLSEGSGVDNVTLSWSAPGNNGGSAVTSYQYRQRGPSESVWDAGAWTTVPDSDSDSSLTDELSVSLTGLDGEATYTFQVRAVNANGNGEGSEITSKTLSNTPPVFADSNSDGTADAVSRTVEENTASGSVGAAVTATDPDSGDVLVYSVAESSGPDPATDPAADLADFNRDFSLDAATGQVSVGAGAVIDYESRSTYKVAYRVSDNKNAVGGNDPAVDDTLVLTINVSDVNEAPVFAAGSVSRTVTENAASGSVGLAVTATDPDSGHVLAYSVAVTSDVGAADHLADFNRDFSLDTSTGQISVKATAAIDFETRAAYKVTYRVSDGKNAAGGSDPAVDDTLVLTINVSDVNEAPSFSANSVSRTVEENTASGSVGAAVTATDADSGDVLAYSVAVTSETGAADHLADFNRDFSLDTATGQISVKATAAIDYETRAAYKVAYRVSDNKNSAGSVDTAVDDTLTLTVSVGNLNEAGSVSVSGDPEAGATLTASVSDPDGAASGVSWVWSVGASPTGLFSAISGATDVEFVVRAADVGKHLQAAATYTDSTHSASGQTASETVGPVSAANSAPGFAANSASRTVAENAASGSVGAPVTATDADSDALTYSVAESSGPGAAADPAADLADFNRDFSLDAATGQVSVGAGAVIDYESRSTYKVAYRVSDNKNAVGGNDPAVDDTLVLTINVTDANEAPVFAAGSVSRTVTENTTTGNVGLAVTATDPDSGHVLAYSVAVTSDVGAADHLADFNRDFSLDTSTGQVSVKATAAIDFETRSSYKVAYRVSDNKNSAGSVDTAVDDTLVLTVNVSDVNEAPSFSASSVSRTVAENTTTGDVGAAVTATDDDSDALTYSVAESSGPGAAADPAADLADFNRDFSLDAATGQVSVGAGAAIDFEARSAYVVAYRVTDNKNAAGGNDPAIDDTLVLTVDVTDANEAPVFAAGSATRTVAENAATGDVGLAVTAADPDSGDVLAYSVAESSGPGAAADPAADLADFNRDFSLDAATGQVSVGAGAAIDFETRSAYKVAYRVTDNKNAAGGNDPAIDDTLVLTVDVTDANEAPVFAAGSATRTVAENTASGDVGLAVTAADPESGDVLAYSVAESSGPDAAADPAADLADFNRDFSLDAATGQVSVGAGAVIDFEARSAYVVAYRVSDNKNSAGSVDTAVDDTLTLTVSVGNLNEAGSVSVSGDPEAGATLTASVSDPDGAVSGVGWVWSVGASVSGSFSAVSGATGAGFVVRAADVGMYLRAAATYTDVTHTAAGQTAAETVGPVGAANSAPRFADSNSDGTADAVSRTVTENTTTGDVGLAVTATDDDSDALTYSVAESSGPGAAADPAADLADFNRDFSLDAATGQVSVGAGAAIDFETRSAYKVAYRVTDNKNAAGGNDPAIDDTLVLTVDVTDANEAPVFAAGSASRTVAENTAIG